MTGVRALADGLPGRVRASRIVQSDPTPPAPGGGRAIAWVTLEAAGQILSDIGAPALQFASGR
jgi:hypothetical protein